MNLSGLVWLTGRALGLSSRSHRVPRVDDTRVLSGIIFINRDGERWCGAPTAYGPHKTLSDRWNRRSDKGIFARMMGGLAAEQGALKTVIIDATCLEAHRTTTSMGVKKGECPSCWSDQGRHEPLPDRALRGSVPRGTKLHAVCDSQGRPLNLFVTIGQVSDDIIARALVGSLPKVDWRLGDRGSEA